MHISDFPDVHFHHDQPQVLGGDLEVTDGPLLPRLGVGHSQVSHNEVFVVLDVLRVHRVDSTC